MQRFLLLLMMMLFMGFAPPAQAAWLSEVFLGDAGGAGMPRAIEISGVAEPGPVELVIMQAGHPDDLGTVLQVISFEATAEPVQLLSDGDWPSTKWTGVLATLPKAALRTLDEATAGLHSELDLAGSRRLHLYAGQTRIKPDMPRLDPDSELLLRGDAQLLDVLTFGAAGQTVTLDDTETVVDTRAGWVLVRPEGNPPKPGDGHWLVGSPDAHGYLASALGPVKATPGRANPHFDEIHLPEPSSIAIALAGLGVLACRRCQRPA